MEIVFLAERTQFIERGQSVEFNPPEFSIVHITRWKIGHASNRRFFDRARVVRHQVNFCRHPFPWGQGRQRGGGCSGDRMARLEHASWSIAMRVEWEGDMHKDWQCAGHLGYTTPRPSLCRQPLPSSERSTPKVKN